MKPQQRPVLPERLRIPLRVGVVVASYVIYRLPGDDEVIAGIFLGAGATLFGFALVDRWTTWRRDRSGMVQVGTTLLGIALLALGAWRLVAP